MIKFIILCLLFFPLSSYSFDESLELKVSEMGTYHVDVKLGNNNIDMLLDTGAAFIVINEKYKTDEFLYFRTIHAVLADGRKVRVKEYLIPELNIGRCVIRDVMAVIMPGSHSVLGLSALRKISPFFVDLNRKAMYFSCI